jgi:chromosome segregation ATPase
MELEKFEQLHVKVESLISRLDELIQDRDELTRTVEQKNSEIVKLKEAIADSEQQRAQVRSKIDDLLERIDQHL